MLVIHIHRPCSGPWQFIMWDLLPRRGEQLLRHRKHCFKKKLFFFKGNWICSCAPENLHDNNRSVNICFSKGFFHAICLGWLFLIFFFFFCPFFFIWCLRTTEINYLAVLEVTSPKWVSQLKSVCQQDHSPPGGSGRVFPTIFSF